MSNTTDAIWPDSRLIPSTHTVQNVLPFALDLIVDGAAFDGDACEIEELAQKLREVVEASGLLKREPHVAGLRLGVEALRGAQALDGLVDVMNMLGWLSNMEGHDCDDLAAGILAMIPLARTADLIDARAVAEHALRRLAEVAQ